MDINTLMPNELNQQLIAAGQSHLLDALELLDNAGRDRLLRQIEAIDFEQLAALISGEEHATDWSALAAEATSPPAFRLDGHGAKFTSEEAFARGQAALREGKIGAILVAGGQGSRLGFPHPKGMYDLKLPSGRTLFQIFASLMKRFSSTANRSMRSRIRAASTGLRRLRTRPLESTWNGAYAMPKNPGPSLAPPIDTNGGISKSLDLSAS